MSNSRRQRAIANAALKLLALTVPALTAGVASSPARADVIVMQNGDRITGDISRIWDNDVFVEPDYGDEFSVETDSVRYIESDDEFEVTLADGREVTAILGSDTEGNQVLTYENERHRISLTALIEVAEPDEHFDWEANIDWSSTVRNGNTNSETSRFNLDATVSVGDHRNVMTTTLNDESIEDSKTKDQELLTYSYNWLFGARWFAGGNVSYESDPIRELDRRLLLGAGLGRDIWDMPDRTMNLQFGLGRQDETLAGVSEQNKVAYWIFRFRYELGSADVEFFHNHWVTEYISGRDNTIFKSSTGVRYEITDLFYLTTSLEYDKESDPAPDNAEVDRTFVIGVGFEF